MKISNLNNQSHAAVLDAYQECRPSIGLSKDGASGANIEDIMNTIIDLGSELLVDRSTIGDPYLRLIVAALGESVIEGSPWAAISKQELGRYFGIANTFVQ